MDLFSNIDNNNIGFTTILFTNEFTNESFSLIDPD